MSTKKILTSLAVFIVALALGFVGFVRWKLQPQINPQPLRAELPGFEDGTQW